jgi:hypothetical protein
MGCIFLLQSNSVARELPCDIYEEAGTPCVGAFSTVRLLNSSYDGPLYQVRRDDGQTKDIPSTDDGFADASVQDEFLGNRGGTVSKLYDQSGRGNDLTAAKKGCYEGSASRDDKESDAKGRRLTIAGHNVYALYMKEEEGYRSNQENYNGYPDRTAAADGMPTGNQAQGVYEVADGKRVGFHCCWNFGNGSTNNCYGPTGQMNTLFFGTAFWGKGDGQGPWFMNDMEAGVWAGGATEDDPGWGALEMSPGKTRKPNPLNPSMTMDYAFGISKTSTENNTPQYCLRMANAVEGGNPVPNLVTAYDGRGPAPWKMEGSILLGIGGDNSNSSYGTFFEGCITNGRPSDDIDARILQNVRDHHYGSNDPVEEETTLVYLDNTNLNGPASFTAHYIPSSASVIIDYSLAKGRDVNMRVFDQRGRQVATITSGMKQAGNHSATWNTSHATPGVYVVKTAIDGKAGWTDKIVIGK